jgi:hypothetical protein
MGKGTTIQAGRTKAVSAALTPQTIASHAFGRPFNSRTIAPPMALQAMQPIAVWPRPTIRRNASRISVAALRPRHHVAAFGFGDCLIGYHRSQQVPGTSGKVTGNRFDSR